jgi:hypothetical protein
MNGDLRCTQPERWTIVPGFEAPDDEILSYLEHVEGCPFHSLLEDGEMQVVKQDFQTARDVAPDRKLPLSANANDEMLREFENYLNTRERDAEGVAAPIQVADRSRRGPTPRKFWPLSIKQRTFAAGLAVVVIVSIAFWRVAHRTPVAVAPMDLSAGGPESPRPDISPPPAISIRDSGGIIQLDDQGNLHGLPSDLSPPNVAAIQEALKEQHVVIAPLPRELRMQTDQRMGANDSPAFTLLRPVQKIILTSTPTFTWKALDGATTYTVSVYDENDKLVVSSEPLNSTIWKIPQGKSLRRGKVYRWEVTAMKNGEEFTSSVSAANSVRKRAVEAKFKVLDQSAEYEINAAKKRYKDFHLLLGIIYARSGLAEEAEAEFGKLLQANEGSNIARTLMQNVQASRASTR